MALALPLLNAMSWGKMAPANKMPKRMMIGYMAYGVYEPKGEKDLHHDWNWWPCKDQVH